MKKAGKTLRSKKTCICCTKKSFFAKFVTDVWKFHISGAKLREKADFAQKVFTTAQNLAIIRA